MLLMHQMDHFLPSYLEDGAGGNGRGRGQTHASDCRKRLFTDKITGGEKRDGSFLPCWGNYRDFCTALLKIKDRVRGISLRKEGFLWRQLDGSSPHSGARKESGA